MKGVIRFGKSGKLSRRFIGRFCVTKRIGKLAYRVESSLVGVHDVFHVSHLRKCVRDPETNIAPCFINEKFD